MSVFTKKLWAKFDGLDIECFCEEENKKCSLKDKPECKEYVVKFIEIKRDRKQEELQKEIDGTAVQLEMLGNRFKSEVNKTIRHLNRRFKI